MGHTAGADPGIWFRGHIGGLGAEPPVGSRGKAPGGGQGAKPPEADDIFKK
jgi:hypothetical protein